MLMRPMKKVLALCLAAFLAAGSASCGTAATLTSGEIVTQKGVGQGRTPVTVLVKYAFSIKGFETAVEEKFPDIDLVQVGNYSCDMGVNEYEARLEHDDLTDIVMTWPLDVGEEYWADRLLDLSGMDFSSRYHLSMLDDISKDGKLYYLPGPAQVRGIVYNKTLFEEKGWKVPEDYEGFLKLCKTIEDSGIRSLQLGFRNSEVLDTAFTGFNFGGYFSSPQDVQWLSDYDDGTGSFGSHFSGALDVFQEMIDAGIWKASDLDVKYPKREKMLFTRECAMVEDSVLMARMGEEQTGTTDEFALMPFFNPGEDGDWARLYMVCYIGLNKHLADPENKEKYQLVLKLMDYISTPEGQEALASDTGAMFSSLTGTEPPEVSEIDDLLDALNHGRYATFPTLKNAQDALRKGLGGMVLGDTTKEQVIEMVDEQNRNPARREEPEKLGTASKDFTLVETGNFVTDALREWSGCEIALFLDNGKDGLYNGKGISARLYEGDITTTDILRIFPDLKHGENGVVWKVEMTGENLLKTLEYAIPVDNNVTGWYYYFSGLRMEYDPTAEPGKRIRKITDGEGKNIDPNRTYRLAVMDATVPEEYVLSKEDTGKSVLTLLEEAVKKAGAVSPSGDGRFAVPVAADN